MGDIKGKGVGNVSCIFVCVHLHVHACMSFYCSCQCASVMAECLCRLRHPRRV